MAREVRARDRIRREERAWHQRPRSSGRALPAVGHPGEKNNIPDGLKVVQTPDVMLFLYESRTI